MWNWNTDYLRRLKDGEKHMMWFSWEQIVNCRKLKHTDTLRGNRNETILKNTRAWFSKISVHCVHIFSLVHLFFRLRNFDKIWGGPWGCCVLFSNTWRAIANGDAVLNVQGILIIDAIQGWLMFSIHNWQTFSWIGALEIQWHHLLPNDLEPKSWRCCQQFWRLSSVERWQQVHVRPGIQGQGCRSKFPPFKYFPVIANNQNTGYLLNVIFWSKAVYYDAW